MASKSCRTCLSVKPLTDFYHHPRMADGRLNKCKPCVCARVGQHRAANIERIRAYDVSRYRTPERRAFTHASAREYVATHPKARRAHGSVGHALRNGRLVKLPCEVCGTKTTVHAHHDDYDKPLAVRWLCAPHHALWHQQNGPGKNLG